MNVKFPQVNNKSFVPQGGLDLVSPLMLLKDGVAFQAQNWECDLEAGVSKIGGYDRYIFGKTPSEQTFYTASVNVSVGTWISDERVRGATSNATMRLAVRTSGASPQNVTGVAEVYVTDVSGAFQAGETLTKLDGAAATIVLATVPEVLLPDGEPAEREAARAVAEAALRAYMDRPGEGVFEEVTEFARVVKGPTLGCFVLNDIPYVVKESNDDLSETGETWAMFLRPKDESSNRYWEVAHSATSIETEGAHFEFVASNFDNPAGPQTIWGVSGTSLAFRWDPSGPSLNFITTGMAVDRPTHLAIHANRLFLAFKGSLQYSPLNDPWSPWTLVLGANEISMGDDITGLVSLKGASGQSALLISTKERMSILYGASDASFQLVPFSENTGALPFTMQSLSQPIFQNMFGLTALETTQRFGGFNESTISDAIKPFMDARRGKAVASMVCRDKNQYRVFFEDGTAVYATFKAGRVQGMFTERFRHKVTCAWSCVLSDDTELMLIGTEDGGLYKLDVGTGFAGEPIEHFIRFAFNHISSPRLDKHFLRTVVELQAEGYVAVDAGYDLDFGSLRRDVTEDVTLEPGEAGGYWDDETLKWDEGYWDAATHAPLVVDTPGTGANISIRFKGNDNVSHPFTIPAVMFDYTVRKQRRSA